MVWWRAGWWLVLVAGMVACGGAPSVKRGFAKFPPSTAQQKAAQARWLAAWAPPIEAPTTLGSAAASSPTSDAHTLSIVARGAPPKPHEPLRVVASTHYCDQDECLTLRFNRHMVEGDDPTPPDLRFAPELTGEWRWTDGRTLRFDPETLPGANRYRLVVPTTLQALDGTQLVTPFEHTWESRRFEFSHFDEFEDEYEPQSVWATFSHAVDRKTAKRHFNVKVNGKRWPFALRVEGKRVELVFGELLPPGSEVEVEVDPGLRSTDGPIPLGKQHHGQLKVAEAPGLRCFALTETPPEEDVEPRKFDGTQTPKQGHCDPYEGIAIATPNYLPDIEPFLEITPEVNNARVEGRVYADFLPGTTYTVKLKTRDREGNALVTGSGQVVTTELSGSFTFAEVPSVRLAAGRIVRSNELYRTFPLQALNTPVVVSRSRGLTPDALLSFQRSTSNSNEPETKPTPRKAQSVLPPFGALVRHNATLQHQRGWLPATPSQLIGGRTPGVYEVQLRPAGVAQWESTLLNVTDLSLVATASGDRVQVRVETAAGDLVPQANVLLASLKTAAKQEHSTNTSGLVEFTLPPNRLEREEFLVLVQSDNDWTYQQLTVPRSMNPTGLLFTDRGIYRAGETVQIKGVIQQRTAAGVRPLQGGRFLLRVSGAAGAILEQEVTPTEFGSFHVALPLAPELARLSYVVTVTRVGEERAISKTTFRVADYEPDVFEAAAEYTSSSISDGEKLDCVASGTGLHGGYLTGARVDVVLETRQLGYASVPVPPGFEVFLPHFAEADSRATETTAKGQLDALGKWVVNHDYQLRSHQPHEATCRATVKGPHEQTRTSETQALIHPRVYVAARTPEPVRAGGRIKSAILLLDKAGHALQPREGLSVHVKAQVQHADEYNAVWEPLASQRWALLTNPLPLELSVPNRASIRHVGVELQVMDGTRRIGEALVEWSVQNNAATQASPVGPLSLGPNGPHRATHTVLPPPASDALRLELEQPSAEEGDVLVANVYDPLLQNAQGRLLVVGAGMQRELVFDLANHRAKVRLDVDQTMVPEVMLIARVGINEQAREAQSTLLVGTARRALGVAVELPSLTAPPAATTEVSVKTLHHGLPVSAEVTLYAVDEGSLRLTRYTTPDPMAALYDLESPEYRVTRSASERVSWGRVRPYGHGSHSPKVRMGGGMLSGRRFRSNFTQTPLFVASIITDANGEARQRLRLPDSLTAYRIMAVAVTKDGRFGHGEAKVRTAQPLMLESNLPRKLWQGDSFIANVSITSQHRRRILVATRTQWSVDGTVEDEQLELVRLAPGERKELDAPWFAHRVGKAEMRTWAAAYDETQMLTQRDTPPSQVELVAWASGKGPSPVLFKDAVRVSSEVLAKTHQNVAGVAGEIAERDTLSMSGLAQARADSPGLTLELSTTPLASLRPALASLLTYPYGCTEQLSSRLLPHFALPTLLQTLGLANEGSADSQALPGNFANFTNGLLTKGELAVLLQRVLAKQQHDGGFGLWEESNSNRQLSAFVALVLSRAQLGGLAVPSSTLSGLRKYLLQQAGAALDLADAASSRDNAYPAPPAPSAQDLETAALLVYASHQLGTVTNDEHPQHAALLTALAKHEAQMSPGSLGLWASTMADMGERSESRAKRLLDMLSAPNDDSSFDDTPFATRTHQIAYALLGLTRVAPSHPRVLDTVRSLLSHRTGAGWQSTQTNAWALIALQAYADTHPSFDTKLATLVTSDAAPAFERKFDARHPARMNVPLSELVGDAAPDNASVQVTIADPRSLAPATSYYSAVLKTKKDGFAPKGEAHGLELEIRYGAVEKHSMGADLAVSATGSFLVTVTSPIPRSYVALEIPLPAGVSASAADSRSRYESEVRYEVREDKVLMFFDYLPSGTSDYSFKVLGRFAGRFQLPGARIFEMYNEGVHASTAPGWFTVAPLDAETRRLHADVERERQRLFVDR